MQTSCLFLAKKSSGIARKSWITFEILAFSVRKSRAQRRKFYKKLLVRQLCCVSISVSVTTIFVHLKVFWNMNKKLLLKKF